MCRVLGGTLVVVLCCLAGWPTVEAPVDARLLEARAAFDEAAWHQRDGSYADAIPRSEHALALREAVLGPKHPEVATSLDQLGTLLVERGDTVRAGVLLQRALDIREAAPGTNPLDVARSLGNLAVFHGDRRHYGHAESLHRRALAIQEAALGREHPEVARTLKNLALVHADQGFHARAEPLFEHALRIQEAALGRNHPEVARTLHSLARLYSVQGLSAQAEPLYESARRIQEEKLGREHPDVARTLSNLARLYSSQGFDARAEALHLRALHILKKSLGQDAPEVAWSLNNLANIYSRRGLYARAEPLHLGALAIMEKALGEKHPDLACALNNLALFYSSQGFYSWAEPLLTRALTLQETALGTRHQDVAKALNNLARLYLDQGLNDRAEPLLTRALDILEAAPGASHSEVARSTLSNLGWLRVDQHRLAEGVSLLSEAFAISERRLRQEALSISESRLSSLLQQLRTEEERLYSLLRAHPEDAGVRRLVLSAVLLRKGRSAEELADLSRTIYRDLGEKDRETFEQLRDVRARFAELSHEGPGTLSPADHRRRLKELAEQGDALDAELAQRSAPLRALTALPPPEQIVDRVAAALPSGGVLVELVAWLDQPLGPVAGTRESQGLHRVHYLALVLFLDGSIRAVDLGTASRIDRAAKNLRAALARRDSGYKRSAQALYALAFQPLLPLLGKARRVYLAPDGQLGLVPFATLHDGQRSLLDSFELSYLTSGKDLLPRADGVSPARSVIVLADPDLTSPLAASQVKTSSSTSRSTGLERFLDTRGASVANPSWVPLPGTRQEAEALQRLMPQAQLFLGKEATRERLLGITTPGVLHIAAHGYFEEDATPVSGSRAVGHFGGFNGGKWPLPQADPLLRSGLVLAGARAPTPPGAARSQANRSLVTALELSGLNLWGTQLVVLSACDTGRGDVKLGQGIYGLRRAFIVAGAETVVTSLWKVNDDSTRLFMEEYYRFLLAGRGRTEALNLAMRKLRESRPHPYYWAPFIALGQDGPLQLAHPSP
ncbi:CHAT domain-containing tetratricopeptide repeat protein [Pyxidicoccus trucidator]|uniref:CHAT domain-containing tetratricopeptide repeat protein n=1 Tax=Pyxidicoccus trucidator TaxID=2709662 RepID=UPI0013DB9418|nr:CHAT domain-containing tetratricopeptide repeat protein [Pyxidicoccus trucidator]